MHSDQYHLLNNDKNNNNIVPSAPPFSPSYDCTLELLKGVAPEIANHAQTVVIELERNGLIGHQAKVCLVLDISSSMENPNRFFSSRKVHQLVNKALALACMFDDDKNIEIIPFGEHANQVFNVTLNNYQNIIDDILWKIGGLQNATNYAEAVKKVREYYFGNNSTSTNNGNPQSSELPIFVIFVTDGDCNLQFQNQALLQFKYASYQPIFFKFLAMKGDQKNVAFDFIQRIDDASVINDGNKKVPEIQKHFIDNADVVILSSPDDLTMQDLLNEYKGYLIEANEKGLLDISPLLDMEYAKNEGRIKTKNFYNQPMIEQVSVCSLCIVM